MPHFVRMAVSLGRGKMVYLALSMFVVTPLQLLIWRAIWKFLDVYISQMPDQVRPRTQKTIWHILHTLQITCVLT